MKKKHFIHNTKPNLSFSKRLLYSTGFVSAGVVACLVQGVFIHNNPAMQNTWLTSGIEGTPTPNPLMEESKKLREENNRLRELVSRGEVDRRTAEIDKNKIINAINKYLSGGLLENKGSVYYDAGLQKKVSPILMAAISIHETSADDKDGNWRPGNSKVLRTCSNVAGINWDGDKDIAHNGRYRVFKNIDESIYNLAYIIRHYYIDQGRNDISSIGAKYAPLDDYENGKYGMDNNCWVDRVTTLYEKISADAK